MENGLAHEFSRLAQLGTKIRGQGHFAIFGPKQGTKGTKIRGQGTQGAKIRGQGAKIRGQGAKIRGQGAKIRAQGAKIRGQGHFAIFGLGFRV